MPGQPHYVKQIKILKITHGSGWLIIWISNVLLWPAGQVYRKNSKMYYNIHKIKNMTNNLAFLKEKLRY